MKFHKVTAVQLTTTLVRRGPPSSDEVDPASFLRLAAHDRREPRGYGMGAAAAPLEQGGEKGAVPEDDREAEM